MALIPLKDTVNIIRVATDSSGEPLIDAWGNPTYADPVSYRCRIEESTRMVRNQQGNEVVSNTRILLDKVVAVSYSDDISYTDATGQVVTLKPVKVSRIKDFSSKVIFTEVSL